MSKSRGIVYCRVSSQEQTQGTSLDGQKEACLEYAKNKDIEIDEVFIEKGESATAADRTELIRALDYCRRHRGKLSAFIVWKIDRFARNQIDHFALRAQLMKYGTTLHSVTEPINDDPIGKMTEGVLAAYAQFENDIRKQRCEGGMHRKITEGIWPWHPPIGYIHSKTRKERRKNQPDEIDPERFYLIQKGLKAFARGEQTVASLTRAFNKWGLKTRTGKPMFPQLVERILKDKFYAGILISPWNKKEYQGLHQPMISMEEYRQILFFKSGRSRNLTAPRLILNPEFPLRGFVYCVCGRKMTASWQTGRNGKKHPYYRCYNEKNCGHYNLNVKRVDIEGMFLDLLRQITPKDNFLEAFKEVVLDVWKRDKSVLEVQTQSHEQELKKLKKRKEEYLEMGAKGEIRPDILTSMIDKIDNQITGLQISRNESKTEEFDLEASISYAVKFIKDPAGHWQNLREIKQKQRFQQLVLPKGLVFDRSKNSFGIARLSHVFELSRTFDGDKTHFVAGAGVEPAIWWL